jgi:hypothetical protein
MTLEEQLQRDLKEAMKARDRLRTDVIRSARAALQRAQQDADKQQYDETIRAIEAQYSTQAERDAALMEHESASVPLDEAAQLAVLKKEAKQRRDAAEIYKQAGAYERQQQEEAEAAILESYLPRMLSADELRPQVAAIIAELGVSGPAAMGQVMPVLVERFKGQAEGRVLNQLARELLTSR